MNTLFEIIKYAGESGEHLFATLMVIMFMGIALFFILSASLRAIFPIFKIDRSTHNYYQEKKDAGTDVDIS